MSGYIHAQHFLFHGKRNILREIGHIRHGAFHGTHSQILISHLSAQVEKGHLAGQILFTAVLG